MEGNTDSDHSMTWEDFFGSTTDLAPSLICIYDSLLEPSKRPEAQIQTAKDARNDPPVSSKRDKHDPPINTPKVTNDPLVKETGEKIDPQVKTKSIIDPVKKDKIATLEVKGVEERIKVNNVREVEIVCEVSKTVYQEMGVKDPTMLAGSVKLPITSVNKNSLCNLRTKSDKGYEKSDENDLTCSDSVVINKSRTLRDKSDVTIGTLSPNVKRMISSAGESSTLKVQKKTNNPTRASTRFKSNIPLVGATSKISQSGVEIISSIGIYDQPSVSKANDDLKPIAIKPEFKIEAEATYDVPTNNRPAIYDIPTTNKTAFESLSLPYIDQSIEVSITCDREFDTKLPSKETSPQKSPPKVPPRKVEVNKLKGTNSLNRKDFNPKQLGKTGPYPETIGSTGNLKSAIPEKEVVRLNTSSEVTRPLSMSSIASSSSTSSSGVQNKGVNSAYLASIESLDDNSDADLTSANGSNNFVNSTGILNKSVSEERNSEEISSRQIASEEISGLSQLERVCSEIVQTENVYVDDLRQVVEGYLHVWRRETTFSEEELDELFNNIEDIYAFNSTLCAALNCCQLDATCIARCFVDNTSGFSVYTSYCTGYPRTMQRLAALASNQNSAREFRERQIALGHMLPLASYLLKPVQRILKYHLLLQNVVKQCASRDTEYALLQMTGIAQHIDDMKRRHEHAVRVQEIQSLLYGWNGPDLTTYGELCAEGTFRVFGAKAMRHVFLFDKMLLVTKNREDGILAYKSHIMCNNLMLVESIAGAGLSFHVIPWDAPRAQLTLQARSPRHKREWTLLLKRVILENYNAVIPSHARQLVMELGQNKTDDDMLAEKSHNLITQASMRKQLSAPEYLEKRKLDRERRKSFENGIRGRLKKNRKYTLTNSRPKNCDCLQVSAEKGVDYTCDSCYIDLCSDCENEVKDKAEDKCSCRHDDKETLGDKCPECDKALHYIDSGSAEHLERKNSCKCSDFNSSQESFVKDYGPLNKTRGYHSSDNIIDYAEDKNKTRIPKTCLKCEKIKENIVITDAFSNRPSRCNDLYKHKTESLRSKSKDDPQRSKLSKIGTWRRKSEPGLQQNVAGILAKKQESDGEKERGSEKIEFECRNCGSNKITRKLRTSDGTIISDPEVETQKRLPKPNLEIRMYNTKNIPKKISKIKKSRAKGLRVGSDTTAKFYADFSTDISTENILHITESNDSLNIDKPKEPDPILPQTISKDEDIDEETYKKLIEKTDSFKKNELEKVKYLNKQKVINEGSEAEDKLDGEDKPVTESCAETEQPLEQIISQLLMQNREFQKLVKKQQLRHSAQRRHQRLLKSHSNPEHVIASKLDKLKPHYARQSSDNVDLIRGITNDIIVDSNQDTVEDINVDDAETASNTEDHIYETLRLDSKVAEEINSRKINETPKRLSPKLQITNTKEHGPESDYVYLSFDQLNNDDEGIYDVPVKLPQKVEQVPRNDYYVTIESPADRANDNIYDSLVEVCRRRKELSNPTGEYLPMSPDQSPNTPEIWLSRQKEHFNISRDRKSGSLPRSFQVVTSTEDNNMTTFKCKPNSNSKTYLNREGKVKSTDRPFTIASDQSELSFDDVENYMNDGDMLKFNKNKTEAEYGQNISQSTLELEEEIDRCYKNNFEGIDSLDKNKNETPLNTSQPNLNTSITSSCEILPIDKEEKPENKIIHPEHKIYKPTSNVLSLKNVLSRFKNRTPNKTEDTENANEQSSPESAKTEVKSPNEKRSALNPRSYSKNLLQRFRSIIGDEHSDSTENKSDTSSKTIAAAENKENLAKNEIKVVITSTDNSPTTSTIVYSIHNDILSKSVCETTSTNGSESKNIFEPLSHSCDNITQKTETIRPVFDKCVSMVASTASAGSSPSKSSTSSHQIKKMPIYMQGSKHLGARIAQSDYADPSTLKEKSHHKNINVLINKNAIRPDSLFSNSSFVTSSSEGTYLECQKTSTSQVDVKETESTNSDESFYEKSFEKIEQVKDEDVFRDSAVYSDQEDDETKKSTKIKDNSKIEFLRQRSFRSHVTLTSTVTERRVTITNKTLVNTNVDKSNLTSNTTVDKAEGKPKLAPPVPVKPKLSQIPSQRPILAKNLSKNVDERSDTIKRPNKSTFLRSESSPNDKAGGETTKTETKEEPQTMKYQGIQMKRITFERASLDSATRKIKTQEFKKLTPSTETFKLTGETSKISTATTKNTGETSRAVSTASKVTGETSKVTGMTSKMTGETSKMTAKSVFERRMELESMNKTKPSQLKKPSLVEKPKSITNKMANFEKGEAKTNNPLTPSSSSERASTPASRNSVVENEDLKNSWVKQVVNKFQ